MKLLCINSKNIDTFPEIHKRLVNYGTNLTEGEVYETLAKPYINEVGNKVYWIEWIGARLACRFTELLEDNFISEKSLEEINQN